MPPLKPLLRLLLLINLIHPILSFSESLYHEEIYKKVAEEDDLISVFLTNEPTRQLFSTPKHCLRQRRPQKRTRSVKGNVNKTSDIFVSTWMDFMNEFYWDNGQEYTKWTHITEGIQEKEPIYMSGTFLIPLALYMTSMLLTGILAPFIAFILFRSLHCIWIMISHNRTRNMLRKLWTNNEIRKRRQVLMIYMWAKKIPKIRAKLPWILRRHPDEEVPKELKDLIALSSSPSSSMGEDNLDYYYEGMEKEGREAIEANKLKMKSLEEKRQQSLASSQSKKIPKKTVPWRSKAGTTAGGKPSSRKISAIARMSMSVAKIHGTNVDLGLLDKNHTDAHEPADDLHKIHSTDSFHV